MKKIFTLIAGITMAYCTHAQPIISSGNPLTGIDGDHYDSVAATGSSLFGSVANSMDGKLFATNGNKLRYIDPNNFAIIDSMDVDVNYFTGLQSNDTMFGLRNNGTLWRFNTTSKTVIDTLPLSGLYHSRVAERPGSREVWIGGAPIHIVNYSGAMSSVGTIAIGTNIINVKFSSDGTKAYANSGVTKKIYVIDAASKTVTDSLDLAPESPAAFELSADDSKLFVTVTGKIRVYQAAGLTIADSVNVTTQTMNMYRHPTRPEIWCVHHFADSVTIFNANTYALIDSISVGGSPFFLAFGKLTNAVKDIRSNKHIAIYPNPASSELHVHTGTAGETVKVYDLNGRLLLKAITTAQGCTIATDKLAPGIYTIQVTATDGTLHTSKFSKL